MKRLGIFVFYNEQGIVRTYVEHLLKSIHEILDELVIVANGTVRKEEKIKLDKYADRFFQRGNIGYDGGAYKDAFQKFLRGENMEQWDEILLMNDTFYGPFFTWDEIFGVMEGRSCDFWGLSSHPGGKTGLLKDETVSAHVQSYFIVLKKNVFLHPAFLVFWEEMQYPGSFKEAVRNFEIRFSEYFVNLGFRFESWIEVQKSHLKMAGDVGGIEALVERLHFPVFKRKNYMLHNYIGFKRLLKYLSENTEYFVEAIWEDIGYRCKEGAVYRPYNPKQILEFCNIYKTVYLYGKGKCAQNLECFLMDNGIEPSGYIVTETDEVSEKVFVFREFNIEQNMGIIVAVNEKKFDEIIDALKTRIPENQLILPVFE